MHAVGSELAMLCRPHLARNGRLIAEICRARILHARDERERGIALMRQAVTMAADSSDVDRTRYALGLMIGGDEGAALRADSDRVLRERGVANPAAFVRNSFPELFRSG
jgi:hypothetical protein